MNRTSESGLRSAFLRRALRANGIFSAVSGLLLILAAAPLAQLLGVSRPATLIGVGVSLLIYAAWLVRNARREVIDAAEASVAVVLDLVWVVGSLALVVTGRLSKTGNWLVGSIADLVLCFGLLQWYGIRQMRKPDRQA
jgi:hypothetical protein